MVRFLRFLQAVTRQLASQRVFRGGTRDPAPLSGFRRACGYPRDIDTWGDAGLTGEWANKPLSLYGRNSASGTYGYFKKHALCEGDYRDTVKEQPGSASVVQGVSEDLNDIGYSGIGYKTSGVKLFLNPEKDQTKDYITGRFG